VLRAQDHHERAPADSQAEDMENIPLGAVRAAVDDLLGETTDTTAALRPRGGDSRLFGGEVR
jgi:hypothetical protein